MVWKAGLLVVVALVFAAGSAARSNLQSFTDAKGDGPGAPDIVEVQVRHDATSVEFGFVIDGPIYPGAVTDYLIYMDIDPASVNHTVDHYIRYEQQPGGPAIALFRWDGSSFVDVDVPDAQLGVFTGGKTDISFRLSRSAIPKMASFRFYVTTQTRDVPGAVLAQDTAPAAPDYWTYGFTPLKLTAGAVKRAPARASAGKAFTVAIPIVRTDNGEAPSRATVTCVARAGGKSVRARGRLVNGNGSCSMTVPKGSKGTVAVTMSVVVEGVKLTRSVSTAIA